MRNARQFAQHRHAMDIRAVGLLNADQLPRFAGLRSEGLRKFPGAFAFAQAITVITGAHERVVGYRLNAGTSDWLGWRARFDPITGVLELTHDTAEALERLASCMPVWARGPLCANVDATAFMVVVHECFHVLSPLSWTRAGFESYFLTIEVPPEYRACYPRDVVQGPGHFVEEGLVQFLTDGAVARWLYGGSLPVSLAHGWSYREEAAAIAWFARECGARALGELWSLPTGPSRADFMEHQVARWLRDRLKGSGVPHAALRHWLRRRRSPSLWEMLFVARCRVFGDDLMSTLACLHNCFPAPG
jgi:hypothetical protein